MKEVRLSLYHFIVLAGMALSVGISCAGQDDRAGENAEIIQASTEHSVAEAPYFTTDHQGFPVLVWSEKISATEDAGYVVKFARFSRNGHQIIDRGEVHTSRGCSTTSESANKIGFKKDGTMVAVFARRQPTEENRFAGALFYTESHDGGAQWSSPRYLHVGDTTRGLGRSFFDVARLPDGEVGAIWLDSRYRGEGSALMFAKTEGKAGFVKDKVVDTGTCECCRTELKVTENGDIHMFYRKIWQDSVRDIAHVVTRDVGGSFTTPTRISADNWVIYGCPHTGPSVAETDNGLEIAWFTAGTGPGIYRTLYQNDGTYTDRILLSGGGRHPQTIVTGENLVVYLWEEGKTGQESTHGLDHGVSATLPSLQEMSNAGSVVKAQVWSNGNPVREHWVSEANSSASFPVGVALRDGGLGVAWVQETEDGSTAVMYRRSF